MIERSLSLKVKIFSINEFEIMKTNISLNWLSLFNQVFGYFLDKYLVTKFR